MGGNMKWFIGFISSILEFKQEGYLFNIGSLSLVCSPWIIFAQIQGWIKINHHGYYPDFLQMHYFEIFIFLIGAFWALSSIYSLIAQGNHVTKLENNLKNYRMREFEEKKILLGEL
jgi:hypothetical protein